MDVFLVPISPGRDQLYCEPPAGAAVPAGTDGRPPGWWARQMRRFRQAMAEAEDAGHRRASGGDEPSPRLWERLLGKIAESVAELRLLWHLREATDCRLVHADRITSAQALATTKAEMRRDLGKHRRWLLIDALLLAVSAPLTLIPGPNVPALYFSFRVVGHFLSMRGARRGLDHVVWHGEPTPHLTALGAALGLEPEARADALAAIGRSLGLARFASFVERVSVRAG